MLEGGGKALMARPLKKTFFAASLIQREHFQVLQPVISENWKLSIMSKTLRTKLKTLRTKSKTLRTKLKALRTKSKTLERN